MKAMYNAGTLPLGLSLPIVNLFQSFINFFADDDAEEDEEDESSIFAEEEDDSLFGKSDNDEDEEDTEDEDKSKDKSKTKDKSAIVQKQKYRDLYKKTDTQLKEALKRIEGLEKKDDTVDPAKAKQEKEARDYLRGLIEEVLGERESKDERAQRELDEEMESLLEDNDDLTEKQILEVVEELGVTPKQAVAAIRREEKKAGTGKKAKPNVPRSKRGGEGTVEKDGDKPKKPMTLEEASEYAKKKLRELSNR